MVIVGTIEKNQAIRQLASNGKIDISPLEGAWERYLIQTVNHPFPGVDKALIVAGSDRRGASYGLFSLSEMAGVSPWYWWADVPVKKHKTLYVDAPTTVSKTPSVKYRGVFLNDEDWGLKPWAAKTFEKERGNIGPRTYACGIVSTGRSICSAIKLRWSFNALSSILTFSFMGTSPPPIAASCNPLKANVYTFS